MIAGLLCLALIQSGPIRVACVGASITAGVGTTDPATRSYPAQLQRLIGAHYEVRNFGHSGATLSRAGDLPYWSVPEFKAALEFSPQIVVINLGTNDARPENWAKSKDSFVPQCKELIASFRNLPSHPKVFVCIPTPNFAERKENTDFGVVPLMAQAARESGTPAIDLHTILEGRSELFPDKLHPNDEGAGMMAEAVAEAIENPAERKKQWRIVSVDSEEPGEGPAKNAIDGDTYTYWHTNYSSKETRPPHQIVVDMGSTITVTGFRHLPRQDGGENGRVKGFELYFSSDGQTWGSPSLAGEIKNVSGWTTIKLASPVQARYFKFRALSEWHGGPWTSVGELDVQRAITP